MSRAGRTTGILQALAATVFWSSSSLQIDRLTQVYHLSALQISAWRVALVLPILAVILAVRRPASFRLPAADLPVFLAAGVVGIGVSYVTWAESVRLNGPAAAAALGFSAPAFIALGERAFFGVRLSRVAIVAIAVNLLGCALASGVASPGALLHSPLGVIVGLTNGITFTAYTLLNRRTSRLRQGDPLVLLFWIFTMGAAGLLPWGAIAQGSSLVAIRLDLTGWGLLLGVTLGPTLLAYALYNRSLRTMPATYAALLTTLEPPLVAVGSFLLLGRSGNLRQWIGIALIVGAVFAMQLYATRGQGEPEQNEPKPTGRAAERARSGQT